MNSMDHDHEGKKLTQHYLNMEHMRGEEGSREIDGPTTDGNMMLNQMHEMYAVSDGDSMMHEAYAVSDGESMMYGGMPSADDEDCVGDACPKHEGAKKTNRMILDSYHGVSDR